MKILSDQPPNPSDQPPNRSSEPPSGRDEGREGRGALEPLDAPPVGLARVREGVAAGRGPGLWRSFDELAETPEFQRLIENEFPRHAPGEWSEGSADRRDFLKLAGAAVGLAGLTACTRQPFERIVPYVEQPEHLVPGEPQFYATAMTVGGYAVGLLAESHMGRPTKLTGNPGHPSTGGGTDVLAQSATLGLYDPDRSTSIERLGKLVGWEPFLGELEPVMRAQEAIGGEGLRVLTGTVSSPLISAQMAQILERFPRARWIQYEPINDDVARRASAAAFGRIVDARYDLSRADVVLALDSDFLTQGPDHLRHAGDFAARREVRGSKREMNRLYALETTTTATGASADHRKPVRRSQLGRFAAALAARLGASGAAGPAIDLGDPELERWLEAVAADLETHRGRSVVIPGRFTDEGVHVLAHALNEALGNVGTTVSHIEPVAAAAGEQTPTMAELIDDIEAGEVQALFVLDANPVYEAPADLDFAAALDRVPFTVHLGLYKDETGSLCRWHVPQSHFLEGWGDTRAYGGTVTIVQPLIEPLYSSRTVSELLAVIQGSLVSDYELVRAFWSGPTAPVALGGEAGDFEAGWREALHDGFVPGTESPAVAVSVAGAAVSAAISESVAAEGAVAQGGLDLVLRPDPNFYDGRYANNPWLMELPRPLTKMTWDQVALISTATAGTHGVETGDVIRIQVGDRALEAPAWIEPGHADDTITLWLGWGRKNAGRVADGLGANAQKLRPSGAGWALEATIERTGRTERLASTQLHFNLTDYRTASGQAEARHLVRHGTLAEVDHPEFVHEPEHHVPQGTSLLPEWSYDGHAWGMAVDLTTCTGCNACVVACQAENNVPTVGKEQVLAGREMHWIRIDRYYDGDPYDPRIHHQPVMCQHCEKAPCELVCPVGATVHSFEGLNEMVYNRCIGTRYCSNNCPYKVRRFNFFLYNDKQTPVVKMGRNPNVTVRSRGVMEKCTYCVQRINRARIEAKKEGRRIRDGEVVTACQEACPSHAITFGDINDPTSEVARWKAEELDYRLLPELATQPRTTYLAKIRNPNPALVDDASAHGEEADHGAEETATGAGGDHASLDPTPVRPGPSSSGTSPGSAPTASQVLG
ncbi:MAG TPA: TAT-variant-translocated molybdopterin oxidoreductase [Thermoanaerobaculia bacterium]|nr:TAT-variant-translocated molybdopterin oxidoreductase [Thermoanaerobaculia bacterium]